VTTIIGAVAASHTPTIGYALDTGKQHDPVWAPIFKDFENPKQWLAQSKLDALIVIYNDHANSFFFDHYSPFVLGVGEEFGVADEGGGVRQMPAIKGHPELAAHIGRSVMADEFDLSFFQSKSLDHGCFSPLSLLLDRIQIDGKAQWPLPIIPLQVGVLQFPMPSAKRCYALGKALRRAIESFPGNLRIGIIATGGLSHQVHGERAGFNNTKWDSEFLDLIEKDPERLAGMTQAELATLGGMEGSEVIMWLVMRGALSASINKLHQSYYLPSMTGIATVVYENLAAAATAGELMRHRDLVNRQLLGVENLSGTYPYTLERSRKAFRLNQFLHRMTLSEHRQAFADDEDALYASYRLTPEETALLQHRDWRGLIHYGVIFFVLEKWAASLGVSNLHIYAAMRGESLADFMTTRNASNALYSVSSTAVD
jgi:gallate dioxygenase